MVPPGLPRPREGLSPTFNGGTDVDAEYQGGRLANGADEVLLRPGGRLVDRVAYDATWPASAGASIELSEGRLGAAWNDDPVHWCLGTSALPAGDLGSPGRVEWRLPLREAPSGRNEVGDRRAPGR